MNIEQHRNKILWASVYVGAFVFIITLFFFGELPNSTTSFESVISTVLKAFFAGATAIPATLKVLEAITGIECFSEKETESAEPKTP